MRASWSLSYDMCRIVCLLCLAYGVASQELLDVQRQQLPFGALVFPIPDRFEVSQSNETTSDNHFEVDMLRVDLPKINAMADCHTDDGSVISRHYSATLVESAWRNRLNNSTMAFLVENTRMDVSAVSFFAATYLSSILLMSATRTQSVWRVSHFVHVKLNGCWQSFIYCEN